MAVSIRLRREGAKNRPYYKVVVADSRSPRDGKFIEIIGTYDPKKPDHNSTLKLDRIDHWISQGAQPSDTVRSLIKRNKKQSASEAPEAVAPADEPAREAGSSAPATSSDEPAAAVESAAPAASSSDEPAVVVESAAPAAPSNEPVAVESAAPAASSNEPAATESAAPAASSNEPAAVESAAPVAAAEEFTAAVESPATPPPLPK
jgi:small subunit ribosomal protein S16